MLDENVRAAILEMAKRGWGSRRIAQALEISRGTARAVIKSGCVKAPVIQRAQKAEQYRDDIVALYADCKGNLVRVHEELVKQGAQISYQALTGFCRRHEIGKPAKLPAGHYEFLPGEEMQHDTSPHVAPIEGKQRKIQIASMVLCYSRMIFIQLYPSFGRFECKVFLTDALEYFGGACRRCMIDNTSVIRLKGTGRNMVPVPEMAAFGERFGFVFAAHAVGDANRSARVEGHFRYVQNNFLAGRQFTDWDDANCKAVGWCDAVNSKFTRALKASRRELFATERNKLCRLPAFVPKIYALHNRIVDADGYVTVRGNRYSVPYQLIGRDVEVHESKSHIDIFDGPRRRASHQRAIEPSDRRFTIPEHRPPRGQGRARQNPPVAQQELLLAEPRLTAYLDALKRHVHGRGVRVMQRLLRMVRDYPREPLLQAVAEAEKYGLYDLDRLEKMVLRRIRADYFMLSSGCDDE